MIHRLRKTTACPHCAAAATHAVTAGPPSAPTAGDLAVCLYCGGPSLIGSTGKLERMTRKQLRLCRAERRMDELSAPDERLRVVSGAALQQSRKAGAA
jgi:hypothetical protein